MVCVMETEYIKIEAHLTLNCMLDNNYKVKKVFALLI